MQRKMFLLKSIESNIDRSKNMIRHWQFVNVAIDGLEYL